MLLVLTFFIGITTGMLLTGLFFKYKIQSFSEDNETRRAILIQKFVRELDMSPDQEATLTGAVEDFFLSIEEERESFRRSIEPQLLETFAEIRSILTEEQSARMEGIVDNLYPFFGFPEETLPE